MYILDLVAVDKSTSKAGNKGANLGELLRSGFPILPGFVLTTDAFERVVKENLLSEKIAYALSSIDFGNQNDLKEKSRYIENLILTANIPDEIVKEITAAYERLSYGSEIKIMNERALDIIRTGRDKVCVSVRCSVSNHSFPSQTKSFLNVAGSEKIIDGIRRCWASLYSAKAILYAKKKGIESQLPAVVVQKMANPEKSGTIFTSSSDNSKMIFESAWGLGQSIQLGIVNPDFHLIEKSTGKILNKKIPKKLIQVKRDQIGNIVRERVPDEKSSLQVLNESEIKKLWELAIRVESQFGQTQEIEWCEERGKIFLTQTRDFKINSAQEGDVDGKTIAEGIGASPGIAKGKLKIIKTQDDLKKIEKGDIVLTKFNPENLDIGGLILEEGGFSSELATLAREFEIPCVFSVDTKNLREEIIIDGSSGKIYSAEKEASFEPTGSDIRKIITGTEILVNLSHMNEKTADGVGVLFSEQIFAEIGKHPIQTANTNPEEFVQVLVDSVSQIAKSFYPKTVWYRSLDVKTSDFESLEGEDPKEENPFLGFRGIRRSIDEEIIKYELDALKKLHENGLDNVCLLLPFVTNVNELKEVKGIVDFPLKIGISCEIPSCALSIEDFCKEKVDTVSIGITCLSQLVLGVDRGNPNVSKFYSESDPSVLKIVKDVVGLCKRHGIRVGAYGNFSDQKLLEKLIEYGVDFISADEPEKLKENVARIERKILLQKSRERLF